MELGLVLVHGGGELGSRDELQQLGKNAVSSIHGGRLLKVDVDSFANSTSTYQTCRLFPQVLIEWEHVMRESGSDGREDG